MKPEETNVPALIAHVADEIMLVELLVIVQEVSDVPKPFPLITTEVSTGPDVGLSEIAGLTAWTFRNAVSAETKSAMSRISRVTA